MMKAAAVAACAGAILVSFGAPAISAEIPRPGTNGAVERHDESEKRREEWRKLSPEERAARLREFRDKTATNRVEWQKKRDEFERMTPEEREAKRKELKERLQKRIAELREKQANGTLPPQEARDLDRREQILKRFEQVEPRPARPQPPSPQKSTPEN